MPAVANLPQGRFLAMKHKYRGFISGYGGGKTWVGCLAAGIHFLEHPGVNQGYFAPTYGHIRDIYFPTIEEAVFDLGLSVDIKEGNKEVHFYTGKTYRGTAICRSMDKPQNIIGFSIGHAMIDEIDLLPTDKATVAWRKIIARMRKRIPGVKNGVDVTTTPEGFKFAYQTFVQAPTEKPELKHNYGLIQASTYDNAANLPDDYIPSLIETYPAELIDAYLNGQFVNLTSGTVYRNYNREIHASNETIQEEETLFIGLDFNVQHMAAAIAVQRSDGYHFVEEFKDVFDTPDMITLLKERYHDKGHRIIIYPDASGGSRKSVDASSSDLALLRQARFSVRAKSKNPAIKDRVLATNKAFETMKVRVNAKTCPTIANCLEQQAYGANGEPDKSGGHDHMCFTGDTMVRTGKGVYRLDELPESGTIESIAGVFVPYEMAGKTGVNKEIVKVLFSDGSSIRCTPNHCFLTGKKWTKAVDLAGEYVYSNHRHSINRRYVLWLQSLAKQGKTFRALRITFAAITFKELVSGYIGLFTNTTMARSLKVLQSTIRMVIETTTPRKTLLLCPEVNMQHIIQKTRGEKKCLNLLSGLPLQKLQSGTHHLKELNGTKNIIKSIKKACMRFKRLFVLIVKRLFNQHIKVTKKGFVPISVNRRQGLNQGLMMRQSIAKFAGIVFGGTSIELSNTAPTNADQKQNGVMVESVLPAGKADVFCLKTPATGCFALSNGCIVSNCDALGYFVSYEMPVIKPQSTIHRVRAN